VKLRRRQFLYLAASAAALPAVSCIANAQTYPTRPVRIVSAFAPGGGNDIVARLMGQWLSERLGRPFIIANRAGAGGNIGTEAVVRAPADGYTLLLAASNDAITAGDLESVLSVEQSGAPEPRCSPRRRDGIIPGCRPGSARYFRGPCSGSARSSRASIGESIRPMELNGISAASSGLMEWSSAK
jgi:Tripartite tricarboxylate transporter family receptor